MIKIDSKNTTRKDHITIDFFYEQTKNRFNLKLFTKDQDCNKVIVDQNLHRPGLALAGFVDLFSYNRIQVIGNTEMGYLKILSKDQRKKSFERLFKFDIPCIVITNNHEPFPEMIELADKYKITIFGSNYSTTKIVYLISDFLEDQFAPRLSLHGSFVDVYGVGILFVGKSGIGKSEVALDLVERGHRIVADDVVIFTKKGEGILMGSGTKLVEHFMEVRGIGIIDIRSMFGVRAIRYQKRLELVVELEVWDDNTEYTRTGLDSKTISLMDIDIPYVKLPIVPGKNVTVISEVIALNYLLRHYGYDAAKKLQEKLLNSMKNHSRNDRHVDYFEHDFE
ncbi:MAG: HPr kinase/phosphorylase [Ignavibacteriae bacterium]|nr:HPr kinase/phosphorylase [Ignavibacteriota bacterium]